MASGLGCVVAVAHRHNKRAERTTLNQLQTKGHFRINHKRSRTLFIIRLEEHHRLSFVRKENSDALVTRGPFERNAVRCFPPQRGF